MTAAVPTTIALVSVGYCIAAPPIAVANVPTPSAKGTMTGNSPLVMAILAASMRLFIKISELAVVPARDSNSFSILPAYCAASPARLKFVCKVSSCVSSGAIAESDSLPNRSFIVEACTSFGSCLNRVSTSIIVPCASVCIRFATSVALKPNLENAAIWLFVADSPDTRPSAMFLMPVAAISDCTPTPAIEAPNAAICPALIPATSPSGPTRVTISEISFELAAVTLDK